MNKIKTYTFLFIMLMIFNNIIYAKSDTLEFTILFTNSTNGHPLSFNYLEQNNQGGIPARATLIDKIKDSKKGNDFLILDTGGIVLGRPESNLYNGETDIAGINSIDYYASGIGYSELRMSNEGFKALNRKADFYYLCSNVVDINDKEICDTYSIKKIGGFNGIKIGIFSVIATEIADYLPEEIKKEYKFKDPIETARKMVKELKEGKENVDIIIALTYMGIYDDESRISCKTLASSVEGIDIIIDGRTDLNLEEPITINKTKIYQTKKWGLFIGEISIRIENKNIINFEYKSHPVNYQVNGSYVGEKLEEDKKTLRAIENKMYNYDKIIKTPIAKIENGKLDTKNIHIQENEIGNLICDAMLDYSKADIALQNAGGFGIGSITSGDITRESFDNIIRYDNSLILITLTGEEILRVLKYSMENIGKGPFLQVAGVKFKYSKSKKEIIEIKINNNDLNKSSFYKVAINSWIANGGDGYKIFTEITDKEDLCILHREVLYNYLENKKIITPYIDGRITIVE